MTCDSCLALKESLKEGFVNPDRGVCGIGVGSHARFGHHILAYVERGADVPDMIGGVRVRRKYTEPVRSLSMRKYPVVRTLDSFVRPVSGGNSVGAYSSLLGGYVTGTVGLAFQTPDGKTLILSNGHVLGLDTVQRGGATIGAPLFQPGTYFGGSLGKDNFATLYRWGKLDEVKPNTLDWATGLVTNPADVSLGVLNVGTPAVVADPLAGMPVLKMGALSGLTRGTVIDTNATIDVDYEGLFIATFDDQVVIEGAGGPFAIPGDSGSVALATVGGQLVVTGLVFSGSPSIAVANKMTLVQQAAGSSLAVAALLQTTTPGSPLSVATLAVVGAVSSFLTRGATP